jgi:hypothetical protein
VNHRAAQSCQITIGGQMIQRWAFTSLVSVAVFACTDSTAPPGQSTDAHVLSVGEYAAQLRGDPLLTSVSTMLRRPELMQSIDASIGAITDGASNHSTGIAALATARLSLVSSLGEDTLRTVTEGDVLSAVLSATVDRIAQVSGDSAASAFESDPPPSR